MRKSYEVGISPKINLCNSVEVLTNSFGTVITGRSLIIRIAKYLIRHLFVINGILYLQAPRALYPGFPLFHRAASQITNG